VRFGEVIELISGQHIAQSDYNGRSEGIPYLTGPADFGDLHPIITKWTARPKVKAVNGDILITVKGAGLGKLRERSTVGTRNRREKEASVGYRGSKEG
jgi:type I restriction enzyme S subunit